MMMKVLWHKGWCHGQSRGLAKGTAVIPFCFVGLHMLCQCIRMVKFLTTKATFAVVVTLMSTDMVSEMATAGKGFTAVNTFIWFLASVCTYMHGEVACMQKRLAAVVTLMHLISGMRFNVCSEMRIDDERFAAEAAFVRLISGMHPYVYSQITIHCKCFPTVLTLIWLVSTMGTFVLGEVATTSERLGANVTWETLFLTCSYYRAANLAYYITRAVSHCIFESTAVFINTSVCVIVQMGVTVFGHVLYWHSFWVCRLHM